MRHDLVTHGLAAVTRDGQCLIADKNWLGGHVKGLRAHFIDVCNRARTGRMATAYLTWFAAEAHFKTHLSEIEVDCSSQLLEEISGHTTR